MKISAQKSLLPAFQDILLAICLVLPFQSGAQTYTGYTLYAQQQGTKGYLVDMTGATYHSWTFASNKTTCYSTYLLPDGSLLRSVNRTGNSFSGGPVSGEVQKVNWNGTVTWDFVYSTTDYCSHHDHHPMPNGNVLLICYERKTAAQVTQAGCSWTGEMWPEKIVEIQPSGSTGGTVVWEWHIWDHLCQNYNAARDNYVTSIVQHPELLNINYLPQKDWMHANGIDYNPVLDQIIFSSHNLNEVYVIDHSTTTAQAAGHTGGNSGKGGDILYRWGNPAAYQASGSTIFNVVHDAHWVPSTHPAWPNAMCAFNNKGGTGTKSCVDIFNPPYNGYNYTITAGSAFAPATYNWRATYSGSYTQDMGNSQQLPNGNTLICIAQSGFIYEINPSLTQVWSKTVSGSVAQAFRYPPCYVTGTYSATATATPTSDCAGTSVQLNVAATGGDVYTYAWSSSPAGFTSTVQNPSVTPLTTTVYSVTITNGPCSATGSTTVNVSPLPSAAGSVSGPAEVQQGQTGVGYSIDPVAGATGYMWTMPAGATVATGSNTNSVTVDFSVAAVSGNIQVTPVNTCGSGTPSPALAVTVTTPVPVTLTLPGTTVGSEESLCFNAQTTITTGGEGTGFLVTAGGGAVLIAGQSILMLPSTVAAEGSSMLAYITESGQYCNPQAYPSGISDPSEPVAVKWLTAYPNPTRGGITAEFSGGMTGRTVTLQVISVMGSMVFAGQVAADEAFFIPAESLRPGLYLIHATGENGSQVVRVVRE